MRIFFSDLDGTLLDHNTYSLKGALEGIELLRKEDIHLVPVTSKTFDEVQELMNFLGMRSSFVFENGSGIGICSEGRGYEYIIGSHTVSYLEGLIPLVADFFNCDIKILNHISPEEMDRLTGLGLKRSGFALQRKGSLLFLLSGKGEGDMAQLGKLNDSLFSYGVKVTRGGRFYHLIPAECGKDYGVKKIIELYEKDNKRVSLTGAAGDTFNDIPMLKEVDYPYIVKKSDGTWIKTDFQVIRTEKQGPYGFTEAVKDFIKKTAGL